jgi:sn-glycerol 3-phosphate transport system substrate-binding protein
MVVTSRSRRFAPRPRRAAVALVLAGALVASACGGGDDTDEAASGGCPVDALENADGPVDITLWHTYLGLTSDTVNRLADDYNASQDKVRVSVESQGAAVEELVRKYRQAIPTGDLPTIASFDDTSTQFLADSGTIVPAGVCAEADGYTEFEDFLPIVTDYYSIDGVLQPGSFNIGTALLYYNRDHFQAAGLDPDDPPETIAEVHEAARAINEAGVADQPFVMNLTPFILEFWTTGAGASVVDNENGRGDGTTSAGALSNDATRETLETLAAMDEEGLVNAVPGVEGQFDHYFAMGLEQSSMMVETSTAVTTINAVLEGNVDPAELGLDSDLPPIDVNLDAAEFPGLNGAGEGQVGGNVWYMTNTGTDEEQAAAWDFTKYVNQPENQVLWAIEGSYLPPREAAAADPVLQEDWTTTRSGRWMAIAYEMLTRLDPDWPGPLIGPYTETRTAIRDALDEVLLSGGSVDDALTGADEDITSAVEAYNAETF